MLCIGIGGRTVLVGGTAGVKVPGCGSQRRGKEGPDGQGEGPWFDSESTEEWCSALIPSMAHFSLWPGTHGLHHV